jgi:chemotaxis protein methyltransferase CheR
MVLNEFATGCPGFDFQVLATDISTRALDAGRLAVYAEDRTGPVPPHLKKKYFLRSRDRNAGQVRVVPPLRGKVRFLHLNLMANDFGLRETMDVIFCRNVIIYFDRAAQETLLQRICGYLAADGHLFLGHSETLGGMDVRLRAVFPTIYRKER